MDIEYASKNATVHRLYTSHHPVETPSSANFPCHRRYSAPSDSNHSHFSEKPIDTTHIWVYYKVSQQPKPLAKGVYKEKSMNTLRAMKMGQRSKGRERKVFDWDKAATIIKERHPKQAVAGLEELMEWTAGVIWEDGHIVVDSYTYLASTWATPVLVLDGDEIIPCYLMTSKTTYTSKTKWPESAVAIIEGEKK
jgi:hypothetical protein